MINRSVSPLRSCPPALVAIPARNEVERIGACLLALAEQKRGDLPVPPNTFAVLVFVNNSDDGTAALARTIAPSLPYTLDVIEAELGPEEASAGGARRLAMQEAAKRLRAAGHVGGALLTTDADTRVPPHWVADILRLLDGDADAVVGGLRLDAAEEAELPAALKRRGRLEGRYETLLCELQSRLNHEPWDPWPRHANEPGASLALTLRSFEAVGGVPNQALGEDRALCDALRGAGFHIRHAPEATVTTSGRLVGRAPGGCADTMRQRIDDPGARCDPFLEPIWSAIPRYVRARRQPLRPDLPRRPGVKPSSLRLHIGLAHIALAVLRASDARQWPEAERSSASAAPASQASR